MLQNFWHPAYVDDMPRHSALQSAVCSRRLSSAVGGRHRIGRQVAEMAARMVEMAAQQGYFATILLDLVM